MIGRSKTRDTPWEPVATETAILFGTRVAQTNSASSDVTAETVHMVASDPIHAPELLLQGGGRPHMGSRLRGNDNTF